MDDIRVQHASFRYGKWNPRRYVWQWYWPLWIWLRWRGYARIWRGDLAVSELSLGPWTMELLSGLSGREVKMFTRTKDGEPDGPGEVWIKVNRSAWSLLVLLGAWMLLSWLI